MKNLGDNCKRCFCSTCKHLPHCGTMSGDTEEYCNIDCLGKNGQTGSCSEYEKGDCRNKECTEINCNTCIIKYMLI